MPLHDYSCRSCGAVSEILIRVAADTPPRCRSCGGADLVKLLSAHNVGHATRHEASPGGCCDTPGSCGNPGSCCGG